jgi:RNA polymerase sigma factor for flagellar operon FliA
VLSYLPLVKHIVYKKLRELPAACEVDDLLSCGVEALMRSFDRYDPQKGAGLEPFLWTRIHGAVLDELRRRDWAPRSLRRLERELNKARETFTGAHGRPPTRSELAAMMSMTPEQLRERELAIENAEVTSLSSLVITEGDTMIPLVDTIASDDAESNPEYCAGKAQAKERFRRAFGRLPDRDRQVAVLLYVKNLTLQEIGQVLDVSESRVCQIHSQLKRRIRAELEAESHLFSEVA